MEVFVGTLSGFDSVDEYFDAQQKDLGKVSKSYMLGLGNKEDHYGVEIGKKINNARSYCDLSSNDTTATSKCTSMKNIHSFLFGHLISQINP